MCQPLRPSHAVTPLGTDRNILWQDDDSSLKRLWFSLRSPRHLNLFSSSTSHYTSKLTLYSPRLPVSLSSEHTIPFRLHFTACSTSLCRWSPPWKLYESFSLLSYLWAFNYSLPYSLPANCFLYTDLTSLKETVKSLRASIKGLSRHQLPHFDKASCHDGKAHRARNWGWSLANSQQGTEALHPASL